MISCFAALAGLYVLLGATLVAAAQVLIYIGAISVLVLFAIMLTQSKAGPARLVFHHQAWAAALVSLGLALLLTLVVASTAWPDVQAQRLASPADELARLLFSDYVLAFEVVSVLLLAAVIGGVFLAKREREAPPAATLPFPDEEPGS
jgi:NADH:ubiquinone oxidoreductase subunit 6 (subunit J)